MKNGSSLLLQPCRLKASLERVQRLTQAFTDALLAALPQRATALGQALGIQGERIQVCLLPMMMLGARAVPLLHK